MLKEEYDDICGIIDSYTNKDEEQTVISNIGSFLDKICLTCKLFKSLGKYAVYMRIIYLIYSRHYNCFTNNIERLEDLKTEIYTYCVDNGESLDF